MAKARVLEAWRETPSVAAIRLLKPAGYRFMEGQHTDVEIDVNGFRKSHAFSFSCSPLRDYLEFSTRLTGSEFKNAFSKLSPGDSVDVDWAPRRFHLRARYCPFRFP